jgi:sulfur-carrier protein adenylyltransferase/sulfurtransferase
LLTERGFDPVYSLAGGIRAWQGLTAQGPPEQGLGLIRGDEDPARLLAIAYGMELGLRRFHLAAADAARDGHGKNLWASLAQMEVGHLDRVWALYLAASPPHADRQRLETEASAEIMEGGEPVEEALARLEPGKLGALMVLETAMALETQALDLYLRLSMKAQDQAGRQAVIELAQDEKTHLKTLGGMVSAL